MTNFLLTGGAGFIGTALAAKLSERSGNTVRIFDNFWRDSLKHTSIPARDNVSVVEGDVRDKEALDAAMRGVNCVFHLAAIVGVGTVMDHPALTVDVTSRGTLNALELAREHRVELFVNFSTSEVFGPEAQKVSEAGPTPIPPAGAPRWVYAAAKLSSEHGVWAFDDVDGMRTCSVRPFNIYGPGQVGDSATKIFVEKALRDEPVLLHNNGLQIRDWCFIDDMVAALLAISSSRNRVGGRILNIGNGKSCNVATVRDVAKLVVGAADSHSKIVNVPWGHPDVNVRTADVSLVRELLGHRPHVDLKEGISRTVEWHRGLMGG